MSGLIHLWASKEPLADATNWRWTKCGLKVTKQTNVLYASTAADLKIPPDRVCKTCYRLGPPWLVVVK